MPDKISYVMVKKETEGDYLEIVNSKYFSFYNATSYHNRRRVNNPFDSNLPRIYPSLKSGHISSSHAINYVWRGSVD